jgi:hypothetical protein
VYGRLLSNDLTFTINTECANSGRQIEIELDSDLNIIRMTEGSEPVISLTVFNSEKMKERGIVDIF